MKIRLVAPHEHSADALSSPFPLQRVNLPLLAALTPPGHTMTIVEESFAPDDMNETRLYWRLLSEGRLFVRDWWLRGYPPDTLLFQPKSMTADELISGFVRLNRQVYSFGAMIKRFLGMNPWKRTLLGCQAYAGVNLATRKRYFKGLSNLQPFAGASSGIGTH